ncbi:membrane dipeptidase [Sphingomonas gilva]|uniref:Membrane dipeptidase n=1 Tax=Sphingomonas gilva TaxID=2305907 RepID=A0A396RQS3_9SPHN|nr:dipeptidase [Sphingomonas gilva]RHW18729.1 membrane dipeptidase [Sphingomonas gilva]
MTRSSHRFAALSLTVSLLAACAMPPETDPPATTADARAIHERALVLDTHLDTPAFFDLPGWKITDRHSVATDTSEVDIPRMKEGGLDGGFFVIYTSSGPLTAEGYAVAKAHMIRRSDAILRVVRENPDAMQLALTADDAEKIAASGKRIVYVSVENSLGVGDDAAGMRSFMAELYKRGVRMASPVHVKQNQLADSANEPGRFGGFSPLGKQWLAEVNRLGMIPDASHASDAVFDQMLELSTTPIILSHSGPKAVFDHPRNIDDARIRRLAEKGGVIMINSIYLAPRTNNAEREKLSAELDKTPVGPRREEIARKIHAINQVSPVEKADFEMYMASMLHVLKLVGPDHVGLGADWDGGGGVAGMEDVAALPKITERLLAEGYSEADIRKILGGNVIRLLRAAEAAKGR